MNYGGRRTTRSNRTRQVVAATALAIAAVSVTAAWSQTELTEKTTKASTIIYPAESSVSFLEGMGQKETVLPNSAVPMDGELQVEMESWCSEYGVPVEIVLGCVETESGFQETARNGRCYGYMQVSSINLEWLNREIGIRDLKDPTQNVHSGIFILGSLFDKYGDWHKTLVCYNCGEAGAKRDVFDKGRTSSSYSEKVMSRANEWKEVIYQ